MTDAQTIEPFDLFIVGGGINGCGIARDAAGRGLSVFLCEQGDLARGTSSASTKLIHGGLRYLEFHEYRLVREALHEREILLASAPHIIWPMEFVLPHSPSLRPAWMIRIGLFLYDHLAAHKKLPGSYGITFDHNRFGKPLKKFLKRGFVYADCWVEDSRLVTLNALDAAWRGAAIHPDTTFLAARRVGELWEIHIRRKGHEPEYLYARTIVNAAGPGLASVAKLIDGASETMRPLRLIKGSHIVVKRLYEGEHAYILQHPDRRIVFTIPYEDKFTLIGTTELEVDEKELAHPKITEGEITYLCDAVNQYFDKPLSAMDIVHSFSGIRPLFDTDDGHDARKASRDYSLVLDDDNLLTVYGGKITTSRRLSEEAVGMIVTARGEQRSAWTANATLPGGDFHDSLAAFTQSVIEDYPFLPEHLAARLSSHYGTRVHELMSGVADISDLGEHFGATLYQREVDFLCSQEWARTPEDILLRRTKLGLVADDATWQKLAFYLEKHDATRVQAA
jgi:glycerol-3-phosphate dehydrogenase